MANCTTEVDHYVKSLVVEQVPMPTRLPPIPPFVFDVTLPLARMSDQRDVSREYEVQFRVLFCQKHSFVYSSVS